MKILSILLLGIALACSNGGNKESNKLGVITTAPSADYELEESLALEVPVIDDGAIVAQQEQKIIKNARLSFETKEPEATHLRIVELAKIHKGFIQNDNSGKSYNRLFRSMTVRVPTDQFQAFIDGVSEGVAYFDLKDISRQDVTEEFVDLEARLKAKRELEKRYLELLSKAKNVKEMLEIERELSNIREEIEAKQGRLNYLESRVSLSTISIEFYKLTSETGVTVSYGQKMKNALKGGWDGVSVFFLGILYLWPLFLLVIIVILVIRRLLRRQKQKAQKETS
ncbi:MAG: DUF4349 domain-containing protein [Flavobacteriaceae bacterium]|nr:DUF4349 domain-containing protein [Flavobacteriaceae bacterium]